MVGPVAWLNVPTVDHRGVRTLDASRLPVPLLAMVASADGVADVVHVGTVTEVSLTDGVVHVVAECFRPDLVDAVVPCGVDLGDGGARRVVGGVEWAYAAELAAVTLYIGSGTPAFPGAHLKVVS